MTGEGKWRSPFGRLGAVFDQSGAVRRHARPPWPLEVHSSENGSEIWYTEYVIEIKETGQEIVLTLDGMRSLANLLNDVIEAEGSE